MYISGTEIQIEAPALAERRRSATVDPQSMPFSVRTLAGDSPAATVEYAGVPRVSALHNTASSTRLKGLGGAPDTGGTPIVLKGQGLAGQVTLVRFDAKKNSPKAPSTRSTAAGETRLTRRPCPRTRGSSTCRRAPSGAAARPPRRLGCTCTRPGSPPSNRCPRGQAAGGTKVAIHGQNLGCPLAVRSATKGEVVRARPPGPAEGRPAGSSGIPRRRRKSVPVTVTTWESYFTDTGDAPSTALFSYK